MPQSRVVLRWSAYEHEHVERSTEWFAALGIAALALALTSLLFGDALFSILILVGAATIAVLAVHPPELSQFEVSERGVRVNRALHRYDDIISFWVEDETGGHPILLVDTTKFMAPNLVIPLEHVDPHALRAFLKQHADEMPMKEPLSHKLFDYIGL